MVSSSDLHFKDKAQAFVWYVEQGGQRQKSSFYAVVPADGRMVSRLAVSELLRKERRAPDAAGSFSSRREEADTLKAEAESRMKVRQDEDEARKFDRRWVLREDAEAETCVWVSRLRDAAAYHVGRQLLAMIHACGGQAERLAEVQSIVDGALAAAANEIAESEELTVVIGGGGELEDEAC